MKNYYILAIIVIALLSGFGCESSLKDTTLFPSEKVAEVTDLADTIFFGWIRDIAIYQNQLYLADNGKNRVLIADLDFGFMMSLGKGGPGPYEFKGIRSVEVDGGNVFAYDYSGGKIVKFDNSGIATNTYKLSLGFSEFAVKDDMLYASSYDVKELPNFVYDFSGKEEKKRFGLIPDEVLKLPAIHVLMNNNYLINVFRENSFEISVYSLKGELLNSFDLATHDYLKNWLEGLNIASLLRSSDANVRRAQILSMDVYLTENRLYIMPPKMRVNEQSLPPILLSYEIENGDLVKERIIKLRDPDEGNFYSFAITEDDRWFFGFDPASGSLVKLDISNDLSLVK